MGMDSEIQKKHFDVLRDKYQIRLRESTESDDFLYLILRKAELGIQITKPELQWLIDNRLLKAVEFIGLQQYQKNELERLEAEFLNLRFKYKIPENLELEINSSIYSILCKIESGVIPTDSDLELLDNHSLTETTNLIRDILNFSKLKFICKATRHPSQFPEEPLYSILVKLYARETLNDSEADWLLKNDFDETLQIYWQQEDERKAIAEFSHLKEKYHVNFFPDVSISSPLYQILKKLEENQDLRQIDCDWLEQQKLISLIEIDKNLKNSRLFEALKKKYKATQYKSSDSSGRLFQILKNMRSEITEEGIQWLIDEGLFETARIAKEFHFKLLKVKYRIVGQLVVNPFYEIMLKLEREERLDSKQVIQLIEEGHLSRNGKIARAHYSLEARFYEQEYRRTGNKWNLPSASSNWRKADNPENALEATGKANWNGVESDLKAALLVTRGAAFRDLGQLGEAETCARQAMECQPDSHQPYTLLGAVCYDNCQYPEGDRWFAMAVGRGASDTDDEIERIVRMTKDKEKRREVAKYLLKKDSTHYAWANVYMK